MQNPIQKFRQSSIVFEKPGILFENLKTQASSNYPTVQYFLLKLCTRLLLTNVYKRVRRIFLVCLVIESFAKIKNTWFLHTHFFTFLLITQDLSKIKKISNTLWQTLLSRKDMHNFSRKYWSQSKFSIFQTKNLVSWK